MSVGKEKKKNLDLILTPYIKYKSKWIIDLVVKNRTLKLLERNRREKRKSIYFQTFADIVKNQDTGGTVVLYLRERKKIYLNPWRILKIFYE